MEIISSNPIITLLGIIGGIASVYYSILKILEKIKENKDLEKKKALKEAKDHTDLIRADLESRIALLENEISNLKMSVSREIENLKDTHAIELKNLSERVELLREDLRTQHSSILELLTTLVNKN